MSRLDTAAPTLPQRVVRAFRNLKPWQAVVTYLACYALLFALIAAVGSVAFCRSGRVPIWHLDGVAQHIVGLEYYRQYLLQIVQSVLSGHPHLPMYDFSIGMGDNVITGLFSVGYLDIVSAFVVFVPKGGVITFYVVAIVARLFLSGLSFAAFGRYLNARPWAILIGSLAYAFCGFATFAVPRHPFFGIPLMYAPLIFLGLDLVLRRRNPFALIGSIFLFALTGFYFLYMVAIVMVVYAVLRLAYLHGGRNFREIALGLLRSGGASLVGLALAGAVLLPIVKSFLNSARSGRSTGLGLDLLVPSLGNTGDAVVFSIAPSPGWNTLGMCGAVALALCLLLTARIERRKKLYILGFGAVLALIYLLPIGGLAMNGFGYVSQRWTFLLAFFAAALLTYLLPRMVAFVSWRYLAVCGVAACLYVAAAAILLPHVKVRTRHIIVSAAAILLLVLVLLAAVHLFQRFSRPNATRVATAVFCSAVVLSILANVVLVYSSFGYHYAGAFAKRTEITKLYSQVTAPGIAISDADKSTYRIDNTSGSAPNAAMVGDYNGVSSYWSQSNGNYLNGLRSLELAPMNTLVAVRGLNSRAALEALSSVKYKVRNATAGSPGPGYVSETDIASPTPKREIFRNDDALPFGYVYARSIPWSQWDKLGVLDKQEAMLQAAVVDAPGSNTKATDLGYSSTKLSYTSKGSGASLRDGKLQVTKKNGSIRLDFRSPAGTETYIRLVGFNSTGDDKLIARVRSAGTEQAVVYFAEGQSYYYPRPGVAVNLGYGANPRTSATISFDRKGTYSLKAIEVYSYPLSHLPGQVQALREKGLNDAVVDGNTLSGHVRTATTGTLVLGIPFDAGWSASVDGRKVSTFKANALFTGLNVAPGEHDIRLTYTTPWLGLGLASSFVGLMALLTIVWWRQHRRRLANSSTRSTNS